MNVRGLGRLQALGRRLGQSVVPGAIILLYHRVDNPPRDPQLLSVSPENFRGHLEVLRQRANLISMGELASARAAGEIPARAVAVTFDDGYRDNLEQAKPLLHSFGAPATFFIASGYTGSGRAFWWDELDRILLSPGRLPELLQIEIAGEEFVFCLGGDGAYSEWDAAAHADWDVTNKKCPTERHRAYTKLCDLLRVASVPDRERALAALRAWAEDDGDVWGASRPMTEGEVRQLAGGDLCEVAAHTKNHPWLSSLSPREQETEVVGSKIHLEALTGKPVAGFSYPYGGKTDYTPDSVDLVDQAGFDWACSNFPGIARRGSDRFQLPRHLVRNWDKDSFSRFIKRWL